MIRIRSISLSFIGCLLITAWLLAAQVLAYTWLLSFCFVCFMCFIIWASFKGHALPILLFFLPWAPLIKFRPGTISVYTVALLVVLLACLLFKNRRGASAKYVIPALGLAVLTLIVKLLYGYSISNAYVLFFAFLLAFPLVVREIDEGKYDFYDLTVFFSVGIIFAALSSRALLEFSTISRFIEVHEQLAYKRYSGFYGDPNFYSAHITAAMAGILVLLSKLNHVGKRIFLVASLALLTYCGFLSVSKTFLVVAVCVLLLWFVQMLFQRGKISGKLFTLLCILVFGFFVLSSTVFDSLVDLIVMRMVESSGNLTDLTTGRWTIWKNYLDELWNHSALLFFGNGYTNVKLDSHTAHNTIIQAVYQFGITGTAMFVAWFWMYVQTMLRGVKVRSDMLMPIVILLFGVVGPWMSLDMLFFDEIFLLTFYVLVGVRGLFTLKEID